MIPRTQLLTDMKEDAQVSNMQPELLRRFKEFESGTHPLKYFGRFYYVPQQEKCYSLLNRLHLSARIDVLTKSLQDQPTFANKISFSAPVKISFKGLHYYLISTVGSADVINSFYQWIETNKAAWKNLPQLESTEKKDDLVTFGAKRKIDNTEKSKREKRLKLSEPATTVKKEHEKTEKQETLVAQAAPHMASQNNQSAATTAGIAELLKKASKDSSDLLKPNNTKPASPAVEPSLPASFVDYFSSLNVAPKTMDAATAAAAAVSHYSLVPFAIYHEPAASGSGSAALSIGVTVTLPLPSPSEPVSAADKALAAHSASQAKPDTNFKRDKGRGQTGWNCFDIALGLTPEVTADKEATNGTHKKITKKKSLLENSKAQRMTLVKFALDNAANTEFRKLLQPEIKAAMINTAAYLDQEAEKLKKMEVNQKKVRKKTDIKLEETLPKSMHSDPQIKKLVEDYDNASSHKDLIAAVRECNTALGVDVRANLKYTQEDLDKFFASPETRAKHSSAYTAYNTVRTRILTPCEDAFNTYCCSQKIYEQYVNQYYGKFKWVSFIRPISTELQDQNLPTSMVDIAARKAKAQIRIYQKLDKGYFLYTETPARLEYQGKIINIEYIPGSRHFVRLVPKASSLLTSKAALFGAATVKSSSTSSAAASSSMKLKS